MRHLLLLFSLSLSLTAFSQRQAENKAQGRHIAHARKGLDSLREFGCTAFDTVAMNADTLNFPAGMQVTFFIGAIAHHNDSLFNGFGSGVVVLRNSHGKYSFADSVSARRLDFEGRGSLAKCTWWVAIENNLPILKVTGVPGGRVNWIITENASL